MEVEVIFTKNFDDKVKLDFFKLNTDKRIFKGGCYSHRSVWTPYKSDCYCVECCSLQQSYSGWREQAAGSTAVIRLAGRWSRSSNGPCFRDWCRPECRPCCQEILLRRLRRRQIRLDSNLLDRFSDRFIRHRV